MEYMDADDPDIQQNVTMEDTVTDIASLLNETIAESLSRDERQRIIRFLHKTASNCNQSALEQLSGRGLASEVMKNIPKERAFYVMIRQGSLEVFNLFLEVKKFSDEETFQNVSNAMIELNTKRVPIDEKLEVFLQFMLSNYAHRNLCGDAKIDKDFNEWRLHFDLIEENWKALKKDYNDDSYANIDNTFLYRIQTIHNHLYFVKDKRFLKHLPMMETAFCVAMLVSIIKWSSEYMIYRLLINKLDVMRFLDVICRQLFRTRKQIDEFAKKLEKLLDEVSSVKNLSKAQLIADWEKIAPGEKLGENIANKMIKCSKAKMFDPKMTIDEIISSESLELPTKINYQDRRTLRNLKRCFFRIKYLYSVQKCIDHIEAVSSSTDVYCLDLNTAPAIKRFIQVMGEAIKSTTNSPNIPKKLESIFEKALPDFFIPITKHFRENLSHKHSLVKEILARVQEMVFADLTFNAISSIKIIFSIAMIQSISEAARALLGSMRRCRTVGQLATLFQYVPSIENVQHAQEKLFNKVEEMIKKNSELIMNAGTSTIREEPNKAAVLFSSVIQRSLIQSQIGLISKWEIDFDSMKSACLGEAPLRAIYHMIEYNMAYSTGKDIYESIKEYWEPSVFNDRDVYHSRSYSWASMLHVLKHRMSVFKNENYMEQTTEILEEFELLNLKEDEIQWIHKQLLKYYENLFFLDNKYRVMRSFFKTKKLKIDEQRFKLIRKKDEEDLQQIFDSKLENMQKLLKHHRIALVDDLITNIKQVPFIVVMALEHYQLELCEMLITTGHYGDNFNLLKHRIPLIHGRNYRNYLAHDKLSYDVLTDSSRTKVIINAFVMVNGPVVLFGKKSEASVFKFSFPSTTNIFEWTMCQQSLAESIQKLNYANIQKNLNEGADLGGRFCHTIGPLIPFYPSLKTWRLVDPNLLERTMSQMLKFFQAIFPDEFKYISNLSYRSWYAGWQGNFEKSFEIFVTEKVVTNSTLPGHFFYWKNLIKNLQDHSVDFNDADSLERNILLKLTQAGNLSGVKELLTLKPDANINVLDEFGCRPLDYAIKYGFSDLADLFIANTSSLSQHNRQFAIINHLNSFFYHLFEQTDEGTLVKESHILTAVKANNPTALELFAWMIDNNSSLKEQLLSFCIQLAADSNRLSMVKKLLSFSNVNYFSRKYLENGNLALQYAVRNRNLSMIELLLRAGASPHWINYSSFLGPLRTAFLLAVAANSVKLVRSMKPVDWKMYSELHRRPLALWAEFSRPRHPLDFAIENDSLKMVRCLEKIGFSLLDSNGVLRSAIKHNRVKFVEEIFQALEESVEEWDAEASFVGMVGNLLSRWKTIVYLERSGTDTETVLLAVVNAQNWKLMEELFERCRELRKVNGMYLTGIEVFNEQQRIYTDDHKFNPDYTQIFEDFLNRLKSAVGSSCNQFKVQLNDDRIIDAESFDVDSSIKESILMINNIENLQSYFATLQDLLQDTNGLICGKVQDNSATDRYFVICSKAVCILKLSHTALENPLEKMVNVGTSEGVTALYMVAKSEGTLKALKLLLFNGANPLAARRERQTPLGVSLFGSDCSIAICLMKTSVALLDSPFIDGSRPLHIAAISGRLRSLQFLIDQGVDLRALDIHGITAAMYAVAYSHRNVLRLLLDHEPQLANIKSRYGLTLLHMSAAYSDVKTLQLILQYNPDVTEKNILGQTAVGVALPLSKVTWLKIFLQYVRAKNISSSRLVTKRYLSYSLFHMSIKYDDFKTMQIVMEHEIGAELASDLPPSSVEKLRQQLLHKTTAGSTALHVAAMFDKKESIAFILHCEAVYNRHSSQKLDLAQQTDILGQTPFDCATSDHYRLLRDQADSFVETFKRNVVQRAYSENT